MSLQHTFSLIKPDAVRAGHVGEMISALEANGLKPVAQKRLRLSTRQAEQFYAVHRERPFFSELVTFITSGPVVAMVLEGEDAVTRYRTLMGATDPHKADSGTLRARFGGSIGENAVHGSDSEQTAQTEIALFFSGFEICA